MSKRRSTRLQAAMDASFQIPFAVNTTANNLLLEDDTLEHDFFDGLDYTLSTPVPPTRASSSKLIVPNLHPRQQEVLKPVQPEPQNFDRSYDYAEEEQEVEMGNADVSEDTPRRKRVYDSDDRKLTPTPRARKHPHGVGRPKRPSPAPTPISRSPELSEDFLRKLHNDESRSSAVQDLTRRSLSASATPKPKQRSRAASRAPPSVHSTPVRTTASTSSSRSDKGQLRAASRETDMLHHEHASSARTHSAVLLESESDVGEHLDQAAPEPVRGPIRDPYLPERLLSRPPVSSRTRRTSTSQRSRSGSRKRSTSPSHLSRAGHDAVMLPIQEDDEDLQDRGEQPPISKPQQSSGSSVPREKTMAMTKEEGKKKETATESAASSSSTAGASRSGPKASLSLKAAAKRSGDILASQPAPKKRKTDVSVVRSGSKPTEGESSRTPHIQPNPVTAEMPEEDVRADDELGKATTHSAKPVAPEANIRPSSPSRHRLIEPSSELPSGNFNMELARQDLNEGSDEVQNFLSRYAKKYGSGSDTTADALPIIPNVPLPAASTQNNSHLQVPVPPKRCDVASEASAPKGNRIQAKARQHAANPDLKGKSKINDPVPKNGVRKVPPVKVKVSKTHSVPVPKSSDGGASEKIVRQTEVALDEREVASQLPSTMAVDEPPAVSSPRLISSASQENKILPPADQMIIDEPPEQPFEARSDMATSRFTTISSYDTGKGEIADSRAPEDPVLASSASAPSVIPEPPAAPSEPNAPKATIDSAFIRKKRKAEQVDSRDRRLAGGQPPKNPSVSSVAQAPKRKASVEPRTDDMFARKKRDNYLQKGLDLTAHSSRRYAEKPAPETQIEFSRAPSHETARQIAEPSTSTAESIDSKFGNTIAATSQSIASVSDLPAGKRYQKARAGAPSDLEWKDRPDGKTRRVLYKDDSSKRHGKQAAKPDPQTRGVGGQKVKATLSESSRGQVGRQSESGLVDAGNTSTGSIGSAIAERLVSFSQRIMGSFGLLSSHSQTDVAERSTKAVETSEYASHLPDLDHDHLVSTGARGPDIRQRASTSHLPELSPRKVGRHRVDNDRDDMPIGRDGIDRVGPGHRHHANGLKVDVSEDHNYAGNPGPRAPLVSEHLPPEVADATSRPLQKSRKRPAGGEPQEAAEGDVVADNDIELLANDRSRKRTRPSRDESALAAGHAVPSNSSRSDKPRHVMPSSRARTAGARNGTRGLLASSKSKTKIANARRVTTTRDAEASASNKPSVRPDGTDSDGTESSGRAKNSCSLTVPMAPTFTSDVLRQQRLLAKSEREREQREKKDEEKAKSDDTIARNSTSVKAPLSDKQPLHHPLKPTVPHTFRFETDTRVGNRKQEFEARLKTWEQRAASSNSQTASRKPLPDFKSLHSAQEAGLANMAARRRELIAPTIPVSPHFAVDIRLAEREKFEEARRAKEKEAEQMMEEKRRKREEEEEREWREARKRTVPRANAVPEWYAEVPKRTAQSR